MGLLKHFFDNIYCITSRKPNPRKSNFIRQCTKLGFLDDISFYNYDDFDANKYINNFNIVDQGVLNNINIFTQALSHYNCIKDAKDKGYKKILIVEDDVYFLRDLKLFYDTLSAMPLYWDFIKYCTLDDGAFMYKEQFNYFPYFDNVNKICSSCYALSDKGIDAYLLSQNKEFRRSDEILTIFEHFGLDIPLIKFFSSNNICMPFDDLHLLADYCINPIDLNEINYSNYFKVRNIEPSIWSLRSLNKQ